MLAADVVFCRGPAATRVATMRGRGSASWRSHTTSGQQDWSPARPDTNSGLIRLFSSDWQPG